MTKLEWAGERFELTADRAVTWPERETVIVADCHFGKAAAFRHAGVAVPAGTTVSMLDRLGRRLEAARARRLVILGDFFHAAAGRTDGVHDALAAWRREHAKVDVLLVRGNHDDHAGDPPAAWDFRCVDEPHVEGRIAFCHEPETAAPDGVHVLGGHVHPVVRLRDIDGTSLRAPCFLFGPRRAILPAFGAFTGGARVRPVEGERVFLVGPDAVVEASPAGATQTKS